ncbi:hypothetical protein YC2023_115452 [Brassica napus]
MKGFYECMCNGTPLVYAIRLGDLRPVRQVKEFLTPAEPISKDYVKTPKKLLIQMMKPMLELYRELRKGLLMKTAWPQNL